MPTTDGCRRAAAPRCGRANRRGTCARTGTTARARATAPTRAVPRRRPSCRCGPAGGRSTFAVVERPVARAQPTALHVGLLAVGPHLADGHLEIDVGRGRLQPHVDAARAEHHGVGGERLGHVRDRLAAGERLPVVLRRAGEAFAVVGIRALGVGARDRRRVVVEPIGGRRRGCVGAERASGSKYHVVAVAGGATRRRWSRTRRSARPPVRRRRCRRAPGSGARPRTTRGRSRSRWTDRSGRRAGSRRRRTRPRGTLPRAHVRPARCSARAARRRSRGTPPSA